MWWWEGTLDWVDGESLFEEVAFPFLSYGLLNALYARPVLLVLLILTHSIHTVVL